MKKILLIALTLGLAAFVATNAVADDYVTGGFEASGSVMAGTGYQYQNDKNATEGATGVDGTVSYAGPLGRYLGGNNAPNTHSHHFLFFVDEVELDISKSFGENIKLRADLDFARAGSTNPARPTPFVLEQAYATANIPIGNGVEVLLGRFNTPMGFEYVDAIMNYTISESIIIRSQVRPVALTGMKLYYSFSDLVDLHVWAANTLMNDTLNKISDVPAVGGRIGFNWGDEGTESTFGLSPFFGPSSTTSNRHFSMGADMDLNWWATESFAVGLEGVFRRDNALTAANTNQTMGGGLANLHYAFSDVWDGTLKYAYLYQNNGSNGVLGTDYIGSGSMGAGAIGNSVKQQVHEISLAGGYAIAEGATLKLEGRFDIVDPTGPSNNQYVYGGAMAFGYEF